MSVAKKAPASEAPAAAETGPAERSAPAPMLGLSGIVATAKDNLALFTDMPIDQLVSCTRSGDDWVVEIDVIEAPARLGDNDLLATYGLNISSTGQVLSIERLRRYGREDLGAATK